MEKRLASTKQGSRAPQTKNAGYLANTAYHAVILRNYQRFTEQNERMIAGKANKMRRHSPFCFWSNNTVMMMMYSSTEYY